MGIGYRQYDTVEDPKYIDRRRQQRDSRLFVQVDTDLYNFKTGLTTSEAKIIDWIVKPEKMPEFIRDVERGIISRLPVKHGEAKYMSSSDGYFFYLTLNHNLKLTITQYTDDFEEGAYVNFILNDKIVASDIMPVPAIIEAVSNFYRERHNG